MKLTTEQQQYFSAMEQMFNTAGWTLVHRGWKEEQDALAERMFFNAESMSDMVAARTRYGLLDELIKLPEMVEKQKEMALTETSEEEENEVYV